MTFQLTQEEGEFLIKLARKALKEYLKTGKVIGIPNDASSRLLQRSGVFVTINALKHGRKELRGCIGYPHQTTTLLQAVIECAISSATQDPRFTPLSQKELDQTIFEISVLTSPILIKVANPMQLPASIKVGRDGLIVEKGPYRGLLLPQVPVECNWDEEEFLTQCCIKAGLPPDNWLIKATKIHKFQCVIASEVTPNGVVKIKGPELGS